MTFVYFLSGYLRISRKDFVMAKRINRLSDIDEIVNQYLSQKLLILYKSKTSYENSTDKMVGNLEEKNTFSSKKSGMYVEATDYHPLIDYLKFFYKPDILVSGFTKIVNNRQIKASAIFIRLYREARQICRSAF